MENKRRKKPIIYQAKSGQIAFRGDWERETVWGNLNQITELFGRDKSVISRHIKNIFKSGELEPDSVVAIFATTASDGKIYQVDYYNLDVILSVGYRVDSRQATQFRIWATRTLKQHLLQGYTINRKRIGANYEKFQQVVEDVKKLSTGNTRLKTVDALELVKSFAGTWFSLESYDRQTFPKKGFTRKTLAIQSEDLYEAIAALKAELTQKSEATCFFLGEACRSLPQTPSPHAHNASRWVFRHCGKFN